MSTPDENIPRHFTDNQCDQINRLAIAFRAAIKQSQTHRFLPQLQYFPHGACGDASLLFAEYLDNQSYGRAQYVLGYSGQYSHAWLELRGEIIDITADQFEDYAETRFVVQSVAWHKKFLEVLRDVANWRIFDPAVSHSYQAAYDLILGSLVITSHFASTSLALR